MSDKDMGTAEPGIRPKPAHGHTRSFHAAITQQQQELDTKYIVLLRKCCKRDCRLHGSHSFYKRCPSGETIHVHAFCGALNCGTCGPRHVELLRAKLGAAIRQYDLLTCYTLTLPGYYDGDPFEVLMEALKLLKLGHQRKTGEPLRYIAVKSMGTKSGRPHLHLLTDTRWSVRWIKNWWHKHVRATQVRRRVNTLYDVDRLTNYMVCNYLECYLGGVRLKKITASKGIDIAIRPARRRDGQPSEWRRQELPTRTVAACAFGHRVQDTPLNPAKVIVPPKLPVPIPAMMEGISAVTSVNLPSDTKAPLRRRPSTPSPAAVPEGSEGA
jgi:hypothetical protein